MILINGQEVDIVKGSLSIEDVIDERTICSFTVIDVNGNYQFKHGQQVIVAEPVGIVFSGVIDRPVKRKVGSDAEHYITCVDWHYLADKRIIAKAYQDEYAGQIVRDIVDQYLSEEGVTMDYEDGEYYLASEYPALFEGFSTVHDGPLIEEAVFNYIPIAQAIETLAEKAGFFWMIDQYKKLFFVPRTAFNAPYTIIGEMIERGSLQIEHGNPKYRNRQYVKGGKDITDPQTEYKVGDGESQSFVVGFPVAKVPTIEISLDGGAWTEQTVGIKGLDDDKQWYWSKGDNSIVQDSDGDVLAAVDKLRITYQGEFSVVVITQNNEEIENQKEIEGGSGIVEDVSDEPSTSTRDAAFQSANAKLQKFGQIGRKIRFRTWKLGLEVGQLIPVLLPEHGLETNMLIELIQITKENNQLWFSVAAAEGATTGSWARIFASFAAGQSFVVRENIDEDQVLITLAEFDRTWESADHPNIFTEVYASDTLYPSDTLFPMFDVADRVREMALLDDDDNIILRKPFTKQTGADTDEIVTTIYISPFEGNGEIAKVLFYGGRNGNVVVDEQTYEHEKTSLEAIQVVKTDTRDFTPASGTVKLTPAYMQALDDAIEQLLQKSQ